MHPLALDVPCHELTIPTRFATSVFVIPGLSVETSHSYSGKTRPLLLPRGILTNLLNYMMMISSNSPTPLEGAIGRLTTEPKRGDLNLQVLVPRRSKQDLGRHSLALVWPCCDNSPYSHY